MDQLEKHKLHIDVVIARHAFLGHAQRWLSDMRERVKKARKGNVNLPEFMTEKRIKKLGELQVGIEEQRMKDIEEVLRQAKKEHPLP